MVQLSRLQLTQAPPDAPAGVVVIDASKLGRRKKGTAKR